MQYKKINNSEALVSQLGLGTWQFSGDSWGDISREECFSVIKSALDCGITYFDTALEYGNGRSEIILGEALRTNREVIISTKIPPKNGEWAPGPNKPINDYFPSDWIVNCCETSLRNLKREYIDILFLHTWSASWFQEVEWFETMENLRRQGKIRSIGISVSDLRADEANFHLEKKRVDVIQVVYNIFEQEPEFTLFPLCEKYEVPVIARCPFSSGVLSGNWNENMQFANNDWRRKWTPKTWLAEQIAMAEYIKPIAQKCKLHISELAILFALQNPAITSVIFGSKKPLHVYQNTTVLDNVIPSEIILEIKKLWFEKKIYGIYNGG